jgi:hypothetical protein
MATAKDCTMLKAHCTAVTRILSGHSLSTGACVRIHKADNLGLYRILICEIYKIASGKAVCCDAQFFYLVFAHEL